MHINRILLICLSSIVTTMDLGAQGLNEKISIDPTVKIGKLSNGLTYYIRKNTKPERKVELRLVVNAGSILEDDDQQGLAHFIEHMAFNGTRNFKKNELVSYLQSIGVKFGADLNAYTGFDETVYILPIPTDKSGNVEKGFQILEDWASTVAFDPEEVDKERSIVMEELRAGKGAEDRIFRKEYLKLFENSRYAERLPIGKDNIIENSKYETLKRFYNDWYRPNLMAVVAVGDIDPKEIEKLIKQHFGRLKNPTKQRKRELFEVPARNKSEGLVATDAEATSHVVRLDYGFRKIKEDNTIGYFRDRAVRALFISMINQRLQELTEQLAPPFIVGQVSIGGYVRGIEAFQTAAIVSNAGVEPAIKSLIQENERARKFGFSASEFNVARKKFSKLVERAYNERDNTESGNLATEYVRNFLQQEPIAGIAKEYEYYSSMLDDISLNELNLYAAKTIPSNNIDKLVILTGPEKTDFKLPSSTELLSITKEAYNIPVTARVDKDLPANLLEEIPKSGVITSEVSNKQLGTTELTLSNNVHIILKPTDFKEDEIMMNASRFGGQYLYENKDRFNAEFSSEIVRQMGVDKFSRTDLSNILAGKAVSVVPRIGTFSETFHGECSATDIETMLQLIYLRFTKPRKDSEAFKSYVSKEQASYRNASARPEFVFQDSVNTILYKKHPRAPKVPTTETYSELNEQRIHEIYKERFGDASGFTFVFVGSFEIEKLRPLLATYLGSLPSTSTEHAFKDIGVRPIKGPLNKEIRKGTEPKSYVRLFWNGEAAYSEDEKLKIQALTELMNIKLIEKLREDIGGIYSGGMSGTMEKYPYSRYSIEVRLPCGPENVDKLIAATISEIEKVKKDGPSSTDLNKVKETWNHHFDESIKDNYFWSRQLIQAVVNEADQGSILTFKQRVDAITTEDIKQAAIRYLDTKNFVQIVLNPEK